MGLIKIKKGLNVPISGEPKQIISNGKSCTKVALVGYDYKGMKPTMAVTVGDHVKLGQLLFTDKKMPGVKYTSPGAGKIVAINRGLKRVFESIVIQLDDKEEEIQFESYPENQLNSLDTEKVKSNLIDSGVWMSFRARPFGKVANPSDNPHSIFVTAMDTNPLAPSIEKILADQKKDFQNGLQVISRLTEGKIYLCKAPNTDIPTIDSSSLSVEEFQGPHPAGNVGTHIHFLDPVHQEIKVWHIDAQDVIAVGKLFTTGRIDVNRVVSLAGPSIKEPRLIATRMGASIDELVENELKQSDADIRIISGSVLSGRTASDSLSFLGRYHQQISALEESSQRSFFGWLSPGFKLFSIKPILFSTLFRKKKFAFNTNINGGHRSVFPLGVYEDVMPMDFEITYLLRSLMVKDIEEAEKLGCLELCEEDLALCSFVSPSKIEYGSVLRENLTIIEKEG